MHPPRAGLLLDILEAAIDDRVDVVELALDLPGRRVAAAPTGASRAAAAPFPALAVAPVAIPPLGPAAACFARGAVAWLAGGLLSGWPLAVARRTAPVAARPVARWPGSGVRLRCGLASRLGCNPRLGGGGSRWGTAAPATPRAPRRPRRDCGGVTGFRRAGGRIGRSFRGGVLAFGSHAEPGGPLQAAAPRVRHAAQAQGRPLSLGFAAALAARLGRKLAAERGPRRRRTAEPRPVPAAAATAALLRVAARGGSRVRRRRIRGGRLGRCSRVGGLGGRSRLRRTLGSLVGVAQGRFLRMRDGNLLPAGKQVKRLARRPRIAG